MRVTGLFIYPIKATAATSVLEAEVRPRGLAGDRRWVVAAEEALARVLDAKVGERARHRREEQEAEHQHGSAAPDHQPSPALEAQVDSIAPGHGFELPRWL